MPQPIQIDRAQFERDGFAVANNVLSAAELATFAPIFAEHLPPDQQPPGIPGNDRNGRKTLISDYTDPRLSNLVGHPRLIAAVEQLTGPFFLANCTSAPVITYKSPPGAERFDLGYHVDWPNNPPKPHDQRHLNCALHFSTVEPGGGALMICPGSHHLVAKNLDNQALRQRMLDQNFNDFPGLSRPLEMCVPAGAAVFFHSYLVHDRSENLLDVPRKVLFTHYKGFDNARQRQAWAASAAERFAQHQVATMDERLLRLCGLNPTA
ncbi:MAG: hypothetical protein GKR89_29245 [Candidatus Latescibacteria bacterium]|nr:hypothetical protein [Candidatus Latescibacterota bacterium]